MALIPEDPKQRNALLAGIVVAAGFYFFWSYWYSPNKEAVDGMASRLEQLDSENRRAQVIAARGGSDLEENLERYERHVALLERLIPQKEEVASLLNDITTEARRSRVELASLRPEDAERGPYYAKESYEIEVVGEYHDLGRFLTSIASLPRIITPVDLELGRFQGDARFLNMRSPLTARLRIQTYILPPPEAGGGQSGGGP